MRIPFEELKISKFEFQIGEVLEVSGPDAKPYLNSQVTSKLTDLKEGEFHHSCVLDLAGKIVASFILCCESATVFYLVVDSDQKLNLLSRLEKYHISEDLEFFDKQLMGKLSINDKPQSGSFTGSYFGKNNTICFEKTGSAIYRDKNFEQLSILTGVPRWGIENSVGELINNTRLDELAVSYSKGCYPGQETVAKIDSRRGAALKPVLLTSKKKLELSTGNISIDLKKIGEIRSFIHLSEGTFAWTVLNRESRIDQNVLKFKLDATEFEMKVNYFPYLKLDTKEIAQDFYDAAVKAFQVEDNATALECFQMAIEIDPSFEDAYESLGVLYGREGDFQKAIEMMERLRVLNPKCLMAYTNLSLYHMKVGNIEIAEKYKSDATLLNFETLGNEAKIRKEKEELEKRKENDRDRREQMFLQVLELDELDAMANNGMGEILFERGDYNSAKEYFEKAITGNAKYSVAYLGLARSFVKLGDKSKLSSVLEKGIKVASSNGDLMPANEMQSMLLKI